MSLILSPSPEMSKGAPPVIIPSSSVSLKYCGDVVIFPKASSIDGALQGVASSITAVREHITMVSKNTSKMLHMIGDFERISDHAVNIIESAEEMREKGFTFTEQAQKEIETMVEAVRDIVERAYRAYVDGDSSLALRVEPLEQVIDNLKKQIRAHHILRLQAGDCSIEVGFVLSDLLTNLERVSDHCSNIAGCIIEMKHSDLDLHQYLGELRSTDENFLREYEKMQKKYSLA